MRALAIVSLILTAACAFAQGAKVEVAERSFTITSPRLQVTVEDGMIVSAKNLLTGEVHADRATADYHMPRGMGHLSGDLASATRLHIIWGSHTMDQQVEAGAGYPNLHHPHEGSTCEVSRIARGAKATWTGLSNGEQVFPEERLTVEMWVEEGSGQVLYRAQASSPEAGVFGVQVPIANLDAGHRFYVNSFGGLYYDRNMNPALITLGQAPFWEAAVVGIEGAQGSLGLWIEDPTLRVSYMFLHWSGDSFGLGLEHLNLMPMEQHKAVESVTWRLDAFAGGWVDAMTPYRDWHHRQFAEQYAIRDAVKWADRIRIIADRMAHDPETWREVAGTFDPATVLVHEWNARAPEFDEEHPDMTPRAGYVERVANLHRYGFRTMAYVNTYCVNYNSPVFERDNIRSFALPRTIRGFWRSDREPVTWESLKDGQLVYLDPLMPRWREYHTNAMIEWNTVTGTDANYEDTSGWVGDFGNGIIDGRSGAEGSIEQFRDLLARNPSVPMAAEYGPDAIAFGVRWPLRYQQVWGNDRTRAWWMERMRPVSAYLFDQRSWVPVLRAESNFLQHVVMACSDSLGGLAQYPCFMNELRATRGVLVQMKQRAQLYSSRQLTPHFTTEKWEPTLACMYRDEAGGVYRYYADPQVHRMVGPDGRALYERVTGRNQFETELSLPGWPAYGAGELLGLDPQARYALVPGVQDKATVHLTDLPEGVKINRHYRTDAFTVLALAPVEGGPTGGSVTLVGDRSFGAVMLNETPAQGPQWNETVKATDPMTYETDFPAHLLFTHGAIGAPALGEPFGERDQKGRYITVQTGTDRGGEYTRVLHRSWPVPGEEGQVEFRHLNQGGDCEVVLDFLVQVPARDASLLVYTHNVQSRYGNGMIGRVYINGRMVHEHDFGPVKNPDWQEGMDAALKSVWDNAIHAWRIPLGHMSGRPVLVSIATDGKASDNADDLYWSRPKFVADPAQQASYVLFTDAGEAVEEPPRGE